ncbi:MAG TPA: nucleotide disphospho-sugar-binding domain-containing protein [Candidatus Bathyarchaeia archaeon]|nr:nucleotide disphospho-sugar-binding domain-containing protein [Candidatus Bathyarchaeia archaeon]
MKKKILFMAEAISWSQLVRPMVLARGLDPSRYEVHFASARFDERLFHGTSFTRWPMTLLPAEKIEAVVASGSLRRLYGKAILEKYVADELRLYEAIRPDLVVADGRFWSTPVSAPAFGVPCATIVDAYWSRRATRGRFPMPDHPIIRLLGAPIAEKIYPIVLPTILRYMAAPTNQLRREYGLPDLGDLFDVLTWGDRLLFPDDPLITPLTHRAPHETFLGPVRWSPQIPLPAFWDDLGRDRPMIYATLGSSGAAFAVPPVLEALGGMDVDVVFSTGGRFTPKNPPRNVRVVEMIPGDLAAQKAELVVCNGGASTGYQALAEGTPIVGIPCNLDQVLAAIAMRDAGAGVLLRAATVTAAKVRAAVKRVIHEASFEQMAQRAAASFKTFDPHARFCAVIDEVTARGSIANETIRSRAVPYISGQSEPVFY